MVTVNLIRGSLWLFTLPSSQTAISQTAIHFILTSYILQYKFPNGDFLGWVDLRLCVYTYIFVCVQIWYGMWYETSVGNPRTTHKDQRTTVLTTTAYYDSLVVLNSSLV